MKLDHPTIPDCSVDVSEKDARDWLAQGWVDPTPKPPKTPRSATTR